MKQTVKYVTSYGSDLANRAMNINMAIKNGSQLFYAKNEIKGVYTAKEYGMNEAYVITKDDKKYNAGSDIFENVYNSDGSKF